MQESAATKQFSLIDQPVEYVKNYFAQLSED